MRYQKALLILSAMLTILSCKKEHNSGSEQDPPHATQVLLKDYMVNNNPWYHFEYDNENRIITAVSQSSLDTMHVIYDGNRIKEMRNDIVGNHDTLRYTYDNSGMVSLITFIGASADFQYRHIHFTYSGQQLKEIVWDFKDGTHGFKVDRQLSYAYYPDGNVRQVTDHYPPLNSQQEATNITTFEQYDNKVNVDGFDLLLYYNDHPYILPGAVLQKNNAMKESRGGDATHLTIDWKYDYNQDNVPSLKTGNVTFLSGPEAGHTFVTRHTFTFY
jgi:hypothetical protein